METHFAKWDLKPWIWTEPAWRDEADPALPLPGLVAPRVPRCPEIPIRKHGICGTKQENAYNHNHNDDTCTVGTLKTRILD